MKKYSRLHLFLISIFAVVCIFTNSYAENDASFLILQEALGVQADGDYTNVNLSNIPEGSVIDAAVVDPSKIGGCKTGDRVELMNLGNDKWVMKHLATGSKVVFSIKYEDGKLKVIKTGSFTPKSEQAQSFSQDQLNLQGRYSLGARVSYVNYSDDDYTVRGTKVDTEPDDAVMFDGNFSYFFTNYFSVELSGGYVETDVDLTGGGSSGTAGELQQIPILLTGRFNIPIQNKLVPYLGGGVGYFINDFDQNDSVIEFIYGPGADVDVDNTWGYHINGGIDFLFTPNLALNLDFKYIWNEIEADVDRAGFTKEEFDVNMFVVGGGIKYYF
jgi:outer membrane protein